MRGLPIRRSNAAFASVYPAIDVGEVDDCGRILDHRPVQRLALAQGSGALGHLGLEFALLLLEAAEQQVEGAGDAGDQHRAVEQETRDEEQVVAELVGGVEHARVAGEGEVGQRSGQHRRDQQPGDAGGEVVALDIDGARARAEDADQHELADDLERRQAASFDVAVGKVAAEDQDAEDKCEQASSSQQQVGANRASDVVKRSQEGGALEVAEGDPELGGQVGVVAGEQVEPLERQRVQDLEGGDADRTDADDQQEAVADPAARVPGQDEDAAQHDDADRLDQRVEQQVVVARGEVEQGTEHDQPADMTEAQQAGSLSGAGVVEVESDHVRVPILGRCCGFRQSNGMRSWQPVRQVTYRGRESAAVWRMSR